MMYYILRWKILLLIKSVYIVTGTLSQEESIECSDNQKEENIDRQENIEKIKREIKEENIEKEAFSIKEVIGTLIVCVCFIIDSKYLNY